MKKKIMMLFVALMTMTSANAQYLNDSEKVFYEGKWFAGVSASNLSLSYYEFEKWRLSLHAKGGYFFADDWMVTANLGYDNSTYGSSTFVLGAGVRYSFESNGINIGAGANFVHNVGVDDFKPRVSIGYTYFLSRHLSIEPEVFFDISTKSSDYTGFGLAIGAGYYF